MKEDASQETKEKAVEDANRKVVEALHKTLRPFWLWRVKSNAEKSLLLSAFSSFSFLLLNEC